MSNLVVTKRTRVQTSNRPTEVKSYDQSFPTDVPEQPKSGQGDRVVFRVEGPDVKE